MIQNEPLDLEKAKAIVKEAEGLGIGILLMLDDSIDCYSKNNLFREQVGERKAYIKRYIGESTFCKRLPHVSVR